MKFPRAGGLSHFLRKWSNHSSSPGPVSNTRPQKPGTQNSSPDGQTLGAGHCWPWVTAQVEDDRPYSFPSLQITAPPKAHEWQSQHRADMLSFSGPCRNRTVLTSCEIEAPEQATSTHWRNSVQKYLLSVFLYKTMHLKSKILRLALQRGIVCKKNLKYSIKNLQLRVRDCSAVECFCWSSRGGGGELFTAGPQMASLGYWVSPRTIYTTQWNSCLKNWREEERELSGNTDKWQNLFLTHTHIHTALGSIPRTGESWGQDKNLLIQTTAWKQSLILGLPKAPDSSLTHCGIQAARHGYFVAALPRVLHPASMNYPTWKTTSAHAWHRTSKKCTGLNLPRLTEFIS